MVDGGGSGDDPSWRVLNQLEFLEVFVRQTKEKGVAVVDAGGDEAVYKNSSGVGREGGAEAIDIT